MYVFCAACGGGGVLVSVRFGLVGVAFSIVYKKDNVTRKEGKESGKERRGGDACVRVLCGRMRGCQGYVRMSEYE